MKVGSVWVVCGWCVVMAIWSLECLLYVCGGWFGADAGTGLADVGAK